MQENLFGGRHRIESTRLASYDYGSNGMYFITVCTRDRACCLGEVSVNPVGECVVESTLLGQRVIEGWLAITHYHPYVFLDAFQLMPNHVHGVLWICKPDYTDWQPNRFGPQRQNLASIVRGFKSGVKTFATRNKIPFDWQPRYYDRVIRNTDELDRIRHYIEANPSTWHLDRDNLENLYM
ncbi:transposase [Spirosoma sp. 209]|uniref:transposase n=1 Tax=Spirosoma sp. 209 TaxID=1955701 RepID=UPI00098D2257|nr:transposase [Spirosoma sp. 209]